MQYALPDSVDCYVRLIAAIDRPAFAAHLDPVNLIMTPRVYFENGALIRECFEKLGPAHRLLPRQGHPAAPPGGAAPRRGDDRRRRPRLSDLPPRAGERLADVPLMLEHLEGAEYAVARDRLFAIGAGRRRRPGMIANISGSVLVPGARGRASIACAQRRPTSRGLDVQGGRRCDRRGAGSARRTSSRSTTCCRPASRAWSRRCTTSRTASSGRPRRSPSASARSAPAATARRRASPGRWSRACRRPRTSRSRPATGKAHLEAYRQTLGNLADAGHRGRLLQLHAGARLDPHRHRLAAAARRHLHALRLHRLRRLRHPHPRAPRRRGGLSRAEVAEAADRALRRRWTRRREASSPPTSPSACPAPTTAGRSTRCGRRSPQYQAMPADDAARAPDRLPRRGGAHRRGGRHPALLPSRRPALPAARPAAGRCRPRDDYAAVLDAVDSPANGVDLLHRLVRRAPRQRPAGDVPPLRRPGPLRPPAQRQAAERRRPRQLLRGRAPRRRHRHGGGHRRDRRRGAPARRRRPRRTSRSRSAPTTARTSSTT